MRPRPHGRLGATPYRRRPPSTPSAFSRRGPARRSFQLAAIVPVSGFDRPVDSERSHDLVAMLMDSNACLDVHGAQAAPSEAEQAFDDECSGGFPAPCDSGPPVVIHRRCSR